MITKYPRSLIVTALIDIGREKHGDGRSMSQYIEWFKNTLKLNCDMMVFASGSLRQLVYANRPDHTLTFFVSQEYCQCPLYFYENTIDEIIHSDEYLSKICDPKRIECRYAPYNVIQYSKFFWLKEAAKQDYDFFFWMDAGCSRFFDSCDISKAWPARILDKFSDRILIQSNHNFKMFFDGMNPQEHIYDNQSMLVGTLFGGNKQSILKVKQGIMQIFEEALNNNMINNEQILLAILAKKNPNLFHLYQQTTYDHLPIFKFLSQHD